MEPEIIYEDNHIIAVNKPRGIPTQQDITGKTSIMEHVKEYIRVKYSKPGNVFLGMVQRLDRPVSGVLVFAKTSKAASRLNEQFLKHSVRKFYIAVVENRIKTEKFEWNILTGNVLKRKGFSEIVDENHKYSKNAELHFMLIDSTEDTSTLLIELKTGRKHQIRAQLSTLGYPVSGDKKYGAKTIYREDKILLHSIFLRINHPTLKHNIDLNAPIPDDMIKYAGQSGTIHSLIKQKINND